MKGPEDLGPQREDTTRAVEDDEEEDNVLDDDDDDDDDDALPAPCEAPVGFRIVDEPPSLAALTPKDPPGPADARRPLHALLLVVRGLVRRRDQGGQRRPASQDGR